MRGVNRVNQGFACRSGLSDFLYNATKQIQWFAREAHIIVVKLKKQGRFSRNLKGF
jgi:hypothetical protein